MMDDRRTITQILHIQTFFGGGVLRIFHNFADFDLLCIPF